MEPAEEFDESKDVGEPEESCEIIARIKAGDTVALAQYIQQYHPMQWLQQIAR